VGVPATQIDTLFNGGGSVGGAGDGGSGRTGSTGSTGPGGTGADPLLAAFQARDPATKKPYTDDFGWINHTWDHPNIDEGCATQNYIEVEIDQNTIWGSTAASKAIRSRAGWASPGALILPTRSGTRIPTS
jgi:hypothetical protein